MIEDRKKWAKGGKARGPRRAKMGVQKGKYCCNRQVPSGSWRFCPFCGRELHGLALPTTKSGVDPEMHFDF